MVYRALFVLAFVAVALMTGHAFASQTPEDGIYVDVYNQGHTGMAWYQLGGSAIVAYPDVADLGDSNVPIVEDVAVFDYVNWPTSFPSWFEYGSAAGLIVKTGGVVRLCFVIALYGSGHADCYERGTYEFGFADYVLHEDVQALYEVLPSGPPPVDMSNGVWLPVGGG